MVHQGADGANGQTRFQCLAHVDNEDRQSVRPLGHFLLRSGAGEQQHEVGMFGARGPDFLPTDDIMIAFAHRGGLERAGVGPAGGLGHAECLQAHFARGNPRQIGLFLSLASVPQQRAHDVHLRMTGAAVASCVLDFFQDGRCGGKGQAGAAICFRNQRGEIAGVIECLHEFGGIGHLAIQPAPILAGKPGAELAHFVANILKIVSFGGHCRAYCD
jgi:hypothetical protein